MRLLIIDDNTEITDMLKQFLEVSDFEVLVVNNGKEGLELIQKDNFDKILLDLAMPGFSGHDVIENLKVKEFTDFHKIIVLSASTMEQNVLDSFSACGIKSILEKPVKMTELIEKIKN